MSGKRIKQVNLVPIQIPETKPSKERKINLKNPLFLIKPKEVKRKE